MTPPATILGNWIADPECAAIHRVEGGGFSGARVWRIDYRDQRFALRRWQDGFPIERLAMIHALQSWLAQNHQPVPVLVRSSATAQTILPCDGSLWELATWLPGEADYRRRPAREKLVAAMHALAHLHQAAARLPVNVPSWVGDTRISPALLKRSENLCKLVLLRVRKLGEGWRGRLPGAEHRLLREALELVGRTAETELQKSKRWESEPLPMQFCLRDVSHEHVLFMADQVTGIIDFGATDFECAAGDVARLLGSMVGDDRAQWSIGLEAYASVRPLSGVERDAIPYFDSSGLVLSTYNWVKWLLKAAGGEPVVWSREAALLRLHQLVERMRVLAAAT